MTAEGTPGLDPNLGHVKPPAPGIRLWLLGGLAAVLIHTAAALPYLAAPEPPLVDAGLEDEGIAVNLAPLVAPPEEDVQPEPEPEPEIEEQVIEERAADSPPPAPPPLPRETPDLPDISPQAIPEIWRGSGQSSGNALTLEEYLALKDWLAQVRKRIIENLGYPAEARKFQLVGFAEVVVTVERNGRITGYHFQSRTGHIILDRAIEDALRRARRVPPFPEGTRHDRLSFIFPIRFELVFEGRVMKTPDGEGAPPPQAPPRPTGLSVAQLSACAQKSADLAVMRAQADAKRTELETLRADYERQSRRYYMRRQEEPRRVRRMLEDYERGVEDYDALVAGFNVAVSAYQSACGGGSASIDNYRTACTPYIATGNPYCEAFTDLWTQLRAQ